MIDYIMGSKIAAPTCRALAAAITERQGRRCVVRFKAMPLAARWGGKCILYGSTVEVPGECLNGAQDVRVASNKLLALKKMSSFGVSCPRLFDDIPSDATVPIVFRKNFRHEGNDNPYIVLPGEAVDIDRAARYDYCMEWIAKKSEYRVTAMLGKVIRIQKKAPIPGTTPNMDIRSNRYGWQLKDMLVCQSGRISQLGIKAVQALGLDFGAADIVKSVNDELFVLEVNTAPGLTARGVRRYSNFFHKWGQNAFSS